MRSNRVLTVGMLCFTLLSFTAGSDVPMLPQASGPTIRPAIFLINEGVEATTVGDAILVTCTSFYQDAVSLLEENVQERARQNARSVQVEMALERVKADAAKKTIPAWVENIVVIFRKSETVVAFFPRSAGWRQSSSGRLGFPVINSYVCTINMQTREVVRRDDAATSVTFVNLYESLLEDGLRSTYAHEEGFVSPLNGE